MGINLAETIDELQENEKWYIQLFCFFYDLIEAFFMMMAEFIFELIKWLSCAAVFCFCIGHFIPGTAEKIFPEQTQITEEQRVQHLEMMKRLDENYGLRKKQREEKYLVEQMQKVKNEEIMHD